MQIAGCDQDARCISKNDVFVLKIKINNVEQQHTYFMRKVCVHNLSQAMKITIKFAMHVFLVHSVL